MATSFFDQLFRPNSSFSLLSRRPTAHNHNKPATALLLSIPPSRPPPKKFGTLVQTNHKHGLKSSNTWAIKQSMVEESTRTESDSGSQELVERLVDFLYEDLPHLFDDQGINQSMYDDRVKFRDPITKHDTIAGYLFNIKLLKLLFRPLFRLHHVQQTGPYEITTRWTMVMQFMLLPWKPELVFTGTSLMGINPQTQKFCSHLDIWDSIKNNSYFSLEGLWDVFRQLRIYKTPDLESPKYQILKRTTNYEVRKYDPFVVAETKGDRLSGSTGFNDVAGYIFGKNSRSEKIPMTTPVFTQANGSQSSTISIQIVLPAEKALEKLPDPSNNEVKLRSVEGGIAAVVKFSGKPTEDIVREKERILRAELLKDGLKPREGCLFARYNDPGRTWSFIMVCVFFSYHECTCLAVNDQPLDDIQEEN